jgi:hypothetical protein
MFEIFRLISTAVLVLVITGGFVWLTERAKPNTLTGQNGMIKPEIWSAWITVVIGVLMFLSGLVFLVYQGGDWTAVVLALLGAAIAGFMVPSVTSVHRVNWDEVGIEGPSRTFGLTLGLARTSIRWSDIEAVGSTITGYWFVQSRDGKRIYWSYLYKGYRSLNLALKRNCPSIALLVRME